MDALLIMKKQKQCSLLSSSSPILCLPDELLVEIFVRVGTYVTVVICKFVSKRWLSLLSDPKFVISLRNYKKKFEQRILRPWAFLSTMGMHCVKPIDHYQSPTHYIFKSSKFSLKFLPFPFKVAATFKDLILCINTATSTPSLINYYICNPMIEQFVALPPTPSLLDAENSCASLICEELYYNNSLNRIDYRFRVVVVNPVPKGEDEHYDPSKLFKLVVFCSETCEWIRIDVNIPRMKVFPWDPCHDHLSPFLSIVCRGMICLRHNLYFGMFDPFDVTTTTNPNAILEAKLIPQIYFAGLVLECRGQLIGLSHYFDSDVLSQVQTRDNDGSGIETLPMTHCVLDLKVALDDIKKKRITQIYQFSVGPCKSEGNLSNKKRIIGIHPTDKKLLYLLDGTEVILCDMKKQCLRSLGELAPDHIESFHRLESQFWPTPIPHFSLDQEPTSVQTQSA